MKQLLAPLLAALSLGSLISRAKEIPFCETVIPRMIEASDNAYILDFLSQNGALAVYRTKASALNPLKNVLSDDNLFSAEEVQKLLGSQLQLGDRIFSPTKVKKVLENSLDKPKYLQRATPLIPNPRTHAGDMPGPKSEADYVKVVDIAANTPAVKHIERTFKHSGQGKELRDAQFAISEFKLDHPLGEGHVKDIENLVNKYNLLKADAARFNKQVYIQGSIDSQVYHFLEQYESNARKQFQNITQSSSERIVLHIPVVDPNTGAIKFKLIILRDYGHFQAKLTQYKALDKSFRKLDKELIEHATRYLRLRTVVDELATTELEDYIDRSNISDPHSTRILAVKDFFYGKFNENDPVTPSLSYLRYASAKIKVENSALWTKEKWKELLVIAGATILPTYALTMALTRTGGFAQSTLNSGQDREMAENPKYWIDKCRNIKDWSVSFTDTIAPLSANNQIESILHNYSAILSAHYKEIIRKKKVANPDYSGNDEIKAAIKLYKIVSDACFQNASFDNQLENATAQIKNYSKQSALQIQLQAFQANEAKNKEQLPAVEKGTTEASIEAISPKLREEIEKLSKEIDSIITRGHKRLEKNTVFSKNPLEIKEEFFNGKKWASEDEFRARQEKFMSELNDVVKYIEELNVMENTLRATQSGGNPDIAKEIQFQIDKIMSETKLLNDKQEEIRALIQDNTFIDLGN